MSAADTPPTGRDELREAMTEAIYHDRLFAGSVFQAGEAADALLPVVAAWAERQARQRAAEELRAAANEVPRFSPAIIAKWLRERADTLSAPESRTTAPDHLSTHATDARGVTGRSRQGIGNDDGGAR